MMEADIEGLKTHAGRLLWRALVGIRAAARHQAVRGDGGLSPLHKILALQPISRS